MHSVTWADVLWTIFFSFGGVVVFVGLWMEKKYDKESYSTIEDFRLSKAKRKSGWLILMSGIALEVMFGLAHAYKDVRQINTIDPLNRNVAEISANVILKLEGTNFEHFDDPFTPRLDNWVTLMENATNEANFSAGSISVLMAEDVLPFVSSKQLDGTPVSRGYVIRYVENPMDVFEKKGEAKESRPVVGDVVEKVNLLRISPAFIPKEQKIIGGSATLTINGLIRKRFVVYPQATDDAFLKLNPNWKSLVFLATNSVP